MVEIGKPDNLLRKIFLILMLTVIPVAIVVRLWLVIVTYWQLILSVFLIGSGALFIYFNFKAYTVKTVVLKFKDWLKKREGVVEDVPNKITESAAVERGKGFLIVGLGAELAGFYLLTQFIRSH